MNWRRFLFPLGPTTKRPRTNVPLVISWNKPIYPFTAESGKTPLRGRNEDRLKHHLTCEFAGRTLGSITRNELQDLLDRKAASTLSFNTVNHLQSDLKQIFRMAVTEDYLRKNPAELLFTPRQAHRAIGRAMTWQDVRLLFSVLEARELTVCMLATVAGMRPGEIFALKWKYIKTDDVEIEQRLYRGKIDSPKTNQSKRSVALSQGLQAEIAKWRFMSGDPGPEAWVFPSESL